MSEEQQQGYELGLHFAPREVQRFRLHSRASLRDPSGDSPSSEHKLDSVIDLRVSHVDESTCTSHVQIGHVGETYENDGRRVAGFDMRLIASHSPAEIIVGAANTLFYGRVSGLTSSRAVSTLLIAMCALPQEPVGLNDEWVRETCATLDASPCLLKGRLTRLEMVTAGISATVHFELTTADGGSSSQLALRYISLSGTILFEAGRIDMVKTTSVEHVEICGASDAGETPIMGVLTSIDVLERDGREIGEAVAVESAPLEHAPDDVSGSLEEQVPDASVVAGGKWGLGLSFVDDSIYRYRYHSVKSKAGSSSRVELTCRYAMRVTDVDYRLPTARVSLEWIDGKVAGDGDLPEWYKEADEKDEADPATVFITTYGAVIVDSESPLTSRSALRPMWLGYSMLPAKDVEIGEQWNVELPDAASQTASSLVCHLESFDNTDRGRVAILGFRLQVPDPVVGASALSTSPLQSLYGKMAVLWHQGVITHMHVTSDSVLAQKPDSEGEDPDEQVFHTVETLILDEGGEDAGDGVAAPRLPPLNNPPILSKEEDLPANGTLSVVATGHS